MNKRFCYYIPPTQTPDPECGYRVAVVTEHEGGYRWTGDDNWRTERGRKPYFWGATLREAEKVARENNRDLLGLSERDTLDIITTSMAAETFAERREGARKSR